MPLRPTEPSRGDDGDRAGGAAGLERGRAGGPRRRRRRTRVTAQPRSRSRSASGNSGAAAYPSPTSRQLTGSLGSANGRPSGPVTSSRAPGGQAGQPAGAGAGGLDDELEGGAVPAGRALTRWIQNARRARCAGATSPPTETRDEGAGAEPLGDAGRDQGEVAVGADLLGREHLAGDVHRAVTVAVMRRPDAARGDPRGQQRALVDERGVALEQGRAGVEPGAGVATVVMPPTADQREVGRRPGRGAAAAPRASARSSGAPESPPAPIASTSAGSRAQARRGEIVVLVAMIPSSPSADGEVGDGEHVVVGEVGGDLDQQRHPLRR